MLISMQQSATVATALVSIYYFIYRNFNLTVPQRRPLHSATGAMFLGMDSRSFLFIYKFCNKLVISI